MGKTSAKKMKTSKRSYIVNLAIVLLICVFLIGLVSTRIEISHQKQQIAAAQQVLVQKKEENAELNELVKKENEEAYMERIARDVLGYVLPGESVYYDVSTGN